MIRGRIRSSLKLYPRKYLPSLLAPFCILLRGAKEDGSFAAWASLTLFLCIATFLRVPIRISWRRDGKILLLAACLVLSQLFSLDPSASLFRTTQGLIFLLLWFTMKSDPTPWFQETPFWTGLWIAGCITVALSFYQVSRDMPMVGWLPRNPNFNAAWMASCVVAYAARLSFQKRMGLGVMLDSGLTILMGILVVVGHSRSALVAMTIGLLYIALKRYSYQQCALGGLLLLAVLVALPAPLLLNRFHLASENLFGNVVVDYRLSIWKVALQGMLDHPLTGTGLDTFEWVFHKYAFPVKEDPVLFSRTTQFAHNEYLQAGSDLGLPALCLLCMAVVSLISSSTDLRPTWQIPAKGALITLGIAALFNPVWHMPFLLFLTVVWTSHSVLQPPSSVHNKSLHRGERKIPLGLGLLGASCLMLPVIWFGLRSYWSSRGEWEKIVTWNPEDANAWYELGMRQQNRLRAVDALNRAIEYSPYRFDYHESLGSLWESSLDPRDLPFALSEYKKTLQNAPFRAITVLAMGRIFYREGEWAEALACFEKACQIEPNYWESYLWQARCYYELGDKKRAIWLLHYLPIRRSQFLARYPSGYEPHSGYERIILSYNSSIIQRDLHRFLSSER